MWWLGRHCERFYGRSCFLAAGRIPVAAEALQAELTALVNVIPLAEAQSIGKVIFSTDCAILKQAMVTNAYDLSRLGPFIIHAKYLISTSFIQCEFEHIPRLCNKPAHELAALGVCSDHVDPVLWFEDFPPDVMCMVADDVVLNK